MAELSLQSGHAANRLPGLKVVSFGGGVQTLAAERKTEGLLVLHSDQPLEVESVSGGRAHLRLGWDGTLGYSLFGLELEVPEAGQVVVKLKAVPPPEKPLPTTEAETQAFLDDLAHRPSRFPSEAVAFRKWQQVYREALALWLMDGGLPDRVPLEAQVLETRDLPGFALRKVQYHSQRDRVNTALLSLPKGVAHAPLLLALHGHEAPWGEADPGAYQQGHADDFCAYFATHGWAVLQPATMNHQLQHAGWTLQGEWTWDALVALDYAATVPEVDMSRVAVCGLSTGGHLAMNVLALDDRVKAGVVGCVFSTWNHYRRLRIPPHCDCGLSSQLRGRLEQCDWALLAAPKPVQFQHGRKDACYCPGADPSLLNLAWNTGVMPQEEYDAAFHEVERGYALAGGQGRAVTRLHDGPHQVNSEAAFEWLSRWMR